MRVAPTSSQGLSVPLQSVQRAEYWGVILAPQGYSGIHIGIDNLNVLRGVAKIIDNGITDTPLPLVKDGDLLAALIGNNGADTAADLGRLRQQDGVINARRALIWVRRHWYPIMLELHKFVVAISRIEVNHDGYGGTALDAMIWDKRWCSQTTSFLHSSYCGSCLPPRSPRFLDSSWCSLSPLTITQEVAVWPYSVGILLDFFSFLATLHWRWALLT